MFCDTSSLCDIQNVWNVNDQSSETCRRLIINLRIPCDNSSCLRCFTRRVYSSRIPAGFLSRCSRSFNDSGRREARPEEGRKISFCMRIAEPQETSIHSSWLSSPVYVRVWSPCVCMRAWSLDFLVKPATEWASTNGGGSMALEVWIIHEDISLHSPLRRVSLPCAPRAPLSFLLSRIYSPRPPFIRPGTASCLPDLLTPASNISISKR